MTKPNGGAAFPRPFSTNGARSIEDLYNCEEQDGMTLRDYFAAAALTGMLANKYSVPGNRPESNCDQIPAAAYRCADAMLAERSK